MTSKRTDLPSASATNFPARVRETLMTYLGKQGDPLDRGLTLRDLMQVGLLQLRPGATLRPGSGGTPPVIPNTGLGGGGEEYKPDLTPPPDVTGLTATGALSHILVECGEPVYLQGHGHLRTRVYGVVVEPGDPLPVFADAAELGQFTGQVWALASNPATTWRLWAKWESVDGVLSVSPAGGVNGVLATTSKIGNADLGPLIIEAGNLAAGAVTEVKIDDNAITAPKMAAGAIAVGSAAIQDGAIVNAMIGDAAIDDAKVANLSAAKLTAGDGTIGGVLKSSNFLTGVSGWRVMPDGTAEFSGATVRGTVYANAGQIGGITLAAEGLATAPYGSGAGFYIGADGRLSLGDKLTWDGAQLNINGGGTFSGDLNAAGGTFKGDLSAAGGTFSGDLNAAGGTFGGELLAGVLDPGKLSGERYEYRSPGTYYVAVPQGKTTMRVTLVGGGGAGGSTWSTEYVGGGGGGGGLSLQTFANLPAGATVTVVVGGSDGNSAIYVNGTLYIAAYTGSGGESDGKNSAAGGAGGSGNAANGQHGGSGTYVPGYDIGESHVDGYGVGGKGGDSGGTRGVGGASVSSTSHAHGKAGGAYGGGGGGAVGRMNNNASYGGAGGGGFASVEFFNPSSVVLFTDYNVLLAALQRQGIATT